MPQQRRLGFSAVVLQSCCQTTDFLRLGIAQQTPDVALELREQLIRAQRFRLVMLSLNFSLAQKRFLAGEVGRETEDKRGRFHKHVVLFTFS
jgi:hypothetical protein